MSTGAPSQPTPQPPPPAASSAASTGKGLPSKVYNKLINTADKYVPNKLRPLWQHPAGPKTVFFWAPLFKWSLVIAGLSDLTRPAETLSVQQCSALAATGIIWARYSLVIIPKNYSLFAVNCFVGLVQVIQLTRAFNYHQEQKKLQAVAPSAAAADKKSK